MVFGPQGPPHARQFLIPRKDYAIEDTWHNVGMRGTGSNDLLVQDVKVSGASHAVDGRVSARARRPAHVPIPGHFIAAQ